MLPIMKRADGAKNLLENEYSLKRKRGNDVKPQNVEFLSYNKCLGISEEGEFENRQPNTNTNVLIQQCLFTFVLPTCVIFVVYKVDF